MSILFKRYQDTSEQVVLLSYKGRLTFELIHSFIDNVESALEKSNVSLRSKRKIYNVLVEVFQNLTHHIDHVGDEVKEDYKTATLKVWIEDGICYVATGNYIMNSKVTGLNKKLIHINSLDGDNLRAEFKKTLNNNTFSIKGGGGLGFFDIRKKSDNKFTFSFEKVNADFSYFNFEAKLLVDYN